MDKPTSFTLKTTVVISVVESVWLFSSVFIQNFKELSRSSQILAASGLQQHRRMTSLRSTEKKHSFSMNKAHVHICNESLIYIYAYLYIHTSITAS